MKHKREYNLIWEAFIAENVPGGIGGMFSLNDEPEPDPNSETKADDALTDKGFLKNALQMDLKAVLDKIDIEISNNKLDAADARDLVAFFERQVNNYLEE